MRTKIFPRAAGLAAALASSLVFPGRPLPAGSAPAIARRTSASGDSAELLRLFIALEGRDTWSGRLPAPTADGSDGPFATLGRARDAIRALKRARALPAGGVTVSLRGGTYVLEGTFELSAEDGGTAEAPIIYQAFEGETVRLAGGRRITGFRPVTDPAVRRRLDPAARDHVLRVDLKARGITDYGRLRPRGFGRPMDPAALELFFANRPMQLARWPNEGWARIAAVPAGRQGGRFTYEGDRPARWAKADDVWLHGYWTWDWADSYERVKAIRPEAREIVTEPPHGAYGYTAGKRYRALNILEELDAPGEWYLDRPSGRLYFWPPAPIGSGEAFVSMRGTLIAMRDVSHVTIRGMVLAFCRGTAVEIRGGTGDRIAGCVLANIGNLAVRIEGGEGHGVVGCDILQTGDGGIRLQGGDRKSLRPGHHFAENNHIHHYSRWDRTYRPAVGVSGVGLRVEHNLIHDGPHTAILLGGNENLIAFNEIHHVCRETGDVGAFYMGRDWTTRGNVIRHNFFHHIRGPYTHGAMAVYLDDAASGATIEGNVFFKASRAAFIGGGRDNRVENNIFLGCEPAVHIDARGLGWAKRHIARGGGWHMYEKLRAVRFDRPPYSTRYPALARILEGDPAVPEGNVIARNVCQGGRWLDLAGVDRSIVVFEDNLVGVDPRFVDPEAMNFQLRDDSPAYRIGFKRIPFEEIGLVDGPERARLPRVGAARQRDPRGAMPQRRPGGTAAR